MPEAAGGVNPLRPARRDPPTEQGAIPTRRRPKRSLRRFADVLHGVLLAVVLVPALLIVIYVFVPPVSTLMLGRWLTGQPVARTWIPLRSISPNLPRAVMTSEDSRFCQHFGVDLIEMRNVLEDWEEDGGPSRGASTIAMQTVKNVFLWPGHSYVRKALEIPLAVVIDALWSKPRVMEVYLNIAEWGDGIFGAEAAARRYFRKSARDLTAGEAARLAAVLPNPLRFDAGRPSAFVSRRTGRILARMPNQPTDCL
ncbi:monofunctional biosynthetic peptidoglycan transglycosylase [Chelatococcus reniformis]|uniref:Biosynthetic peptidoglycan transglycosylase n=1 Tax=Chelatococcus reniformis TaxID=1494448 RepID=A0A916UXM0_9HYPH|nr:monofunctional biosynthetic peptidoglycan transglycosylase [Chelatococcus reniformis]GGC92862.1 monofunctional biosynthetic peptidoglycan transglycosylase [Chelatococcus reniformis]